MCVAARIKIGSGQGHGLQQVWYTMWHSHGVARQTRQLAWVSNICSQWRMVLVCAGLKPVGLVENGYDQGILTTKCCSCETKTKLKHHLWCRLVLFCIGPFLMLQLSMSFFHHHELKAKTCGNVTKGVVILGAGFSFVW